MRLSDCHNIDDFRTLAKKRLPFPVFDYIDGAADDELTKARNTAAYDAVDLVPDVLAGVEDIDTSCTILGRKSALPLMLSPPRSSARFTIRAKPPSPRRPRNTGCGSASPALPRALSKRSPR